MCEEHSMAEKNGLLAKIIEAHGGTEAWRRFEKVEASIVSGGGFFALKGVIQDPYPRRGAARAQGFLRGPPDVDALGSVASGLFQRRGYVDLFHHALLPGDEWSSRRGDRGVAGRGGDLARA
jgi:hypothetical protein